MKETGANRVKNSDRRNKRLIEISINNPELGATRLLPLLQREGIHLSGSSVYRILRRNRLNTRAMRLVRQELRNNHPTPATEPATTLEAPESSDDRPFINPPAKPGIPPKIHRALLSVENQSRGRPRQKKVPRKPRRRRAGKFSLFLNIVNPVLVLLAVFIGYRNVEKFLEFRQEPAPVELAVETAEKPVETAAPSPKPLLSDYRAIWEGNLFNISAKKTAEPVREIDPASVDLADESVGLTLLGTVAADRAANRFAVIQTLQGQKVFHEGANADGHTIKKILRNRVIIASADGDRLLSLKSGSAGHETPVQQTTAIALSSPEGAEPASRNTAGGRFWSVKLPYNELVAGLEDVEQLVREVGTRSYSRFGKQIGFRIESVPDDSILEKIGLRSRDVIVAINGVPIKDESEAYAFFEKLAEGEKAYIKYRRRARTRTIELNPI